MPAGLRLRPGMAFATWADTGQALCNLTSASAWWLGDWLLYGERTYGKRYETAAKVVPLSYQTLRNYAWVARRFPLSRRRDKLSFQHHAEVAGLPEVDRELWLERAERMRWSRNELRRHLAEARQSVSVRGAGTSVVRMQVDPAREAQWRAAAAAADEPLVEWLFSVIDAAANSLLCQSAESPRRVSGVAV